jgi:putative DNA primase/helicase
MTPEVLEDGVTQVTEVQANDGAGLRDTPPVTPAGNEVTESPIPGEHDRPCFKVLDEWIEAGGMKYRPGVWSFGIRAGKGDAPAVLTQIWICSPLHVDAVTTDAHDGNFGRYLRFRTTLGKWRTFAMPMDLLRADGADLRGELLAMGVEIDPSQRNALAMYLQHRPPQKRILCALQTGWANSGAFVLPDEVIGPKASGVAFQSSERTSDEYACGGTLQAWQADVGALAVGNPLLCLAVSAAFVGPLLLRCGAESGGIHLVGDSSTGKTTAVEAACSIWGGPSFVRSWRARSNGLEGVAALMNDSLLALDEISQCDPREVGAIVYQLGNGQGKQRASRTGSARPVLRWRCSVLSSGERTIGTTMAEGGHRVKAGQSVRLLDVPAQRSHGAWDELHGSASGAALSDRIKAAARQHYGHAGRAFLQRLTRDRETDFAAAAEGLKALPAFAPANDDGQAKRAAARFALIALAGETAAAYGVAPWPKGEAVKAASTAFRAWQRLRGNASGGGLERQQVAEKLAGFIERHGDARFSEVDLHGDAIVRDRAGWWRAAGEERLYLFTAEGLREALVGFDFGRALDVLQELGAIEKPGADGKRARPVRIGGRVVRLYEIAPSALSGAV